MALRSTVTWSPMPRRTCAASCSWCQSPVSQRLPRADTGNARAHRNVAGPLDVPFTGDIHGWISFKGIRCQTPVRIGARSIAPHIRRPPEGLYHLDANPLEIKKTAQDPARSDLLATFRDELEAWQRDTIAPWLCRDGISVRAVEHHLTSGLALPNRFDFAPANP